MCKEPPNILDTDSVKLEPEAFQRHYSDFQVLSEDLAITRKLKPIDEWANEFEATTYSPAQLVRWAQAKGYAIPALHDKWDERYLR